MSVGAAPSKADVDAAACNLIISLKGVFEDIADLNAFLVRTGSTALAAPPYNYVPGEAATLMSAYADLATLGQIFRGLAKQAGATAAYDYLTFGGLLTGIN